MKKIVTLFLIVLLFGCHSQYKKDPKPKTIWKLTSSIIEVIGGPDWRGIGSTRGEISYILKWDYPPIIVVCQVRDYVTKELEVIYFGPYFVPEDRDSTRKALAYLIKILKKKIEKKEVDKKRKEEYNKIENKNNGLFIGEN